MTHVIRPCLRYTPMDSHTTHTADQRTGYGLLAVILAVMSNALAWLSEPSNMALLNHTIGTVAGLVGLVLGSVRLYDYYKRRKR